MASLSYKTMQRNIRQYDRQTLQLKCLLYINDYQILCETRNISQGGICFALPAEIYIPLGSHVYYQILKKGSSHTRNATVVRIAQDRSNTVIGCISDISPKDLDKLI